MVGEQILALSELHHFGTKIIRAKNLLGLSQRRPGCLCLVKKKQTNKQTREQNIAH